MQTLGNSLSVEADTVGSHFILKGNPAMYFDNDNACEFKSLLRASCSKHLIWIKMIQIPFFAIQDQVIHLTFMPVFQSNIGLDHPDPDPQFSTLPNSDYQCSKPTNQMA